MNRVILRNPKDGNNEWDRIDTGVTPVKDTLIIFDWDDTLAPTAWLNERGFPRNSTKVLTPEQIEVFDKLSTSVLNLLDTAQKLGRVMIITNSQAGWIEECICRFMPRLIPILSTIDIYSARSIFEDEYRGLPDVWKRKMFELEVDKVFGAADLRNVVSVGDGFSERLATISLGSKTTYAKSIKLYELPSPNDILMQLDFMTLYMKDIVLHMGSVDLLVSYI